jgi:hypothetical protein
MATTGAENITPQEEVRLISDVPAPFANKIFLTIFPVGVRITFAKQFGPEFVPSVRNAVFLQYADAISLRAGLIGHLAELNPVQTEQK